MKRKHPRTQILSLKLATKCFDCAGSAKRCASDAFIVNFEHNYLSIVILFSLYSLKLHEEQIHP